MNHKILEVVVTNSQEALEAQRGGADRLELVSELEVGGLTPLLTTVAEVLSAVDIPVRVMLRQSANYITSNNSEIDLLCKNGKTIASLSIDGLVMGFVKYGKIDYEVVRKVSESVPTTKLTFHSAFETVTDPLDAIDNLKNVTQIDRILTNGGPFDWSQRIRRLEQLQEHADPTITIVAAGDIDLEALQLLSKSNLKEIHVGRVAREGNSAAGSVDVKRVSAIRDLLNGN